MAKTILQDKKTGDIYRVDPGSPADRSDNFSRLGTTIDKGGVRDPGTSGGTTIGQYRPSAIQNRYTNPESPLFGRQSALGYSGGGNYAGQSGYSSPIGGGGFGGSAQLGGQSPYDFTSLLGERGYTPGSFVDYASGYGGGVKNYPSPSLGGKDKTPGKFGLDDASRYLQTPTLGVARGGSAQREMTPEGLAGDIYQTRLGNAENLMGQQIRDFQSQTGLAQQFAGEQTGLLGEQTNLAYTQAQRSEEEAIAQIAIDKALAEQDYNAAVEQINEKRQKENDYLKQKLASAGAIDSTAGIDILTTSATNYDKILGSMAGQRGIAMSQFSLNETKVRNAFANAVENIAVGAQGIQQQINQALQSTIAQAYSTLGNNRVAFENARNTALSEYKTTMFEVEQAKRDAQVKAQEAASKAQQQAFANAVTMAGLTGTFTDPVTGESFLTLAGKRFELDRLKASGKGGGGKSSQTNQFYSLAAQEWKNGTLDQAGLDRLLYALPSGQRANAFAEIMTLIQQPAPGPKGVGGAVNQPLPSLSGFANRGTVEGQMKDLGQENGGTGFWQGIFGKPGLGQ